MAKITDSLTPRQREIAQLLSKGYSQQQIADRLGVKVGTVYRHICDIRQRTGLHRVELACKLHSENSLSG